MLTTYAGTYELAPGREFAVIATGDLLFVQASTSRSFRCLSVETRFMSTATPTGFEFVKDAQGRVTHVMVRGMDGDRMAVRGRWPALPWPGDVPGRRTCMVPVLARSKGRRSMNHRISYLMAASLALAVYPHLSLSASPQPTVAEVDILVDGAPQRRYAHNGRWYIEASKGGNMPFGSAILPESVSL